MSPHSFPGVLSAAREGAEWAWVELHEWLAPQLGGYFRVRGFPDPGDLVGEVFLQLARNVGAFEGDIDQFRSWVFMIAHNRLANERRRLKRRPVILRDDLAESDRRTAPSAESEMLADDRQAVERILDGLTADQRSAIALRVVGGFSVIETAEIMGKSPSSVKQLQYRALKALRFQLVEALPEEVPRG